MEIDAFLEKINKHTKAIYENEIKQVSENGSIINWLLGLAGGALIFSFNKYDAIKSEDAWIISIQAIVFVLIITVGFLHRIKIKEFRDKTIAMIRMFDFLQIEFELLPDEIESDLEDERLLTVFDKYLNGDYFEEIDKSVFDKISAGQKRKYKLTRLLTILSIILMVVQFGCFFALILL